MGQLRAFFARSLPEVFWNTEINDTVVRFSFDQQHPACWRSSRLARTIPRLALGGVPKSPQRVRALVARLLPYFAGRGQGGLLVRHAHSYFASRIL
jgi:hypothetical protein